MKSLKGLRPRTLSEAFGPDRVLQRNCCSSVGLRGRHPKIEIGSEPNLKIKKGSGPEPFWKHSDPIGFAKVLLLIGWAPEPTPPNRNRFRTELENKKGTPARNPTGSIRTPSASQRNCCPSTGLRDRHPKTEIGPEQNPQTKNSAPTK